MPQYVKFVNTKNNNVVISNKTQADIIVSSLERINTSNISVHGAIDIRSSNNKINYTLGTCLTHKNPALYDQNTVKHKFEQGAFEFEGVNLKITKTINPSQTIGVPQHPEPSQCSFEFVIAKHLYQNPEHMCISNHNITEISGSIEFNLDLI